MFDIRLIRNSPEAVARALARRGGDWDLSGILEIDARRRDLTHQVENRVADVRRRSRKIGELKRNKASEDEVQAFLAENQRLTAEARSMEGELRELEQKQRDFLLELPNAPHETTPEGRSAEENALVRVWGEKPVFDFAPRAHDELGEALEILDMKR
ncbi:MAG: serine--tRNA ligase, partial [Nitrospinae bacterium]|nr:serine--tRNA ligase [Nitrospinota bacterium]